MIDARSLGGAALAAALRDSRARSLALLCDLDEAQWQVPQRAGLNPPAWELAHVAWFAEYWVLRGPHHAGADGFVHAARPARLAGPDALLDSARLPHPARWRAALPRAAEWEHAAAHIDWGRSVWEWTADDFLPYPGFTPGPYRDYSAPWFGSHPGLRGGSFATHERLHAPCYRNFFLPGRTDVFAGFRTARDP